MRLCGRVAVACTLTLTLGCTGIPFSPIAQALTVEEANQQLSEAQQGLDANKQTRTDIEAELEQARKDADEAQAKLTEARQSVNTSALDLYRSGDDLALPVAVSTKRASVFDYFTQDILRDFYDTEVNAVGTAKELEDDYNTKLARVNELEQALQEENTIVTEAEQKLDEAKAARLEALLSTPGGKIAALASAVSVTTCPEERLKDKDGNPFTWDNNGRLSKYKALGTEVQRKTSVHKGRYKKSTGLWDNWAWASCHQAAAIIIRATVDKDMAMDNPQVCDTYFGDHSGQWQYVGKTSNANDEMLQPGDILCIEKPFTHTCIFLGHEYAQLYHPGTAGVIWEASYNSKRALYPGITDKGSGGPLGATYSVYRYVGEPNGVVDLNNYL